MPSYRGVFRIWHTMFLSQSCTQQSYPVEISTQSNHSYNTRSHVRTNRYLKSSAFGRDAIHLVMARKGSVVPKHSTLSLCCPFASRSMPMRNFSMREPDTNRVCHVCEQSNSPDDAIAIQICSDYHRVPPLLDLGAPCKTLPRFEIYPHR